MAEDFWEHQAREMLRLVESTGQLLADNAAVIEEYGGNRRDLTEIVKGNGKIGEAMLRAAKRTAEVFEQHQLGEDHAV